jgi:ATP-dependent DNA helicase RecQ
MPFPLLETTAPERRAALRAHFGFDAFQGRQEEAIEAHLAGRDLLLTMPTGAGKSLVYQLPALLLEGLTVVISPLIALMKDQVDALERRGIRATFVNSSLDAAARHARLEACVRGEFDLLFVTPERFRSPLFRSLLDDLPVARLAIDEAHCISEWGHDFRPDYWRLGEYRARLGDPPTVALTATATPRVAEEIVTALRLDAPLVIRTGIERPNLYLGCTRVESAEEKTAVLVDRIQRIEGAGIVYSTLIRDLEALHDELKRVGIESLVYHGKLSPRERREMQEHFMESSRALVLATNAFGMGVDKADIRFVLHAQIPRTLEAWTQEVGRAGRDGAPSHCELVLFEEDLAIQQNFIGWANPTREYLFGVYETLRGWGERIQARDLDDLRDELLVKNRGDNRVGISLKWLEVLGVTEGSFETHDLRLVAELASDALPGFVGSEQKHRADLEGLLGMLRFAREEEICRRARLASHFGLAVREGGCDACDVCTEHSPALGEPRGADSRPAPPPRSRPSPRTTAPWQRGDWVRIDRRHFGQVVRVEGEGRGLRLIVESAGDFRRRTVDPRRSRIERVE